MDIATVTGFLASIGILLFTMFHEGKPSMYFNVPGLILVFGGAVAANLISFPMKQFLGSFSAIKKAFIFKLSSVTEEIERMAQFALIAQREGFLALEEKLKDVKDPFLSKGIRLIVDGFPAHSVREILEADLHATKERHAVGKKTMDNMGALAPAFGLIGTLLGLIAMLANLEDPSKIGSAMAVALIATFYGCLLANIICIPIATKLDIRGKEETLLREVMIEGIVSIQAGDKPQMLKEKLRAFISPGQRQSIAESLATASTGS